MPGSPNKKTFRTIYVVLAVVGIALIAYFVYSGMNTPPAIEASSQEEPFQEPEIEPEPEPLVFKQVYPVGKLIESDKRQAYEGGQMRLYIPRLEFEGDVFSGTDDKTLAKGVSLFENAMLPGRNAENSNVSIAGHRDIHGKEFYYIDTIVQGDLIYLTFDGVLFTYEIEDILVTNAYDWDPIRVKEYSCITLQSCTPIGMASDRIFAVGRLISIEEGKGFSK